MHTGGAGAAGGEEGCREQDERCERGPGGAAGAAGRAPGQQEELQRGGQVLQGRHRHLQGAPAVPLLVPQAPESPRH